MSLGEIDVAVLGGGPAGARCAELLAQAGRSVRLYEARDPARAKPCGGLLNRRAQDLLAELGGLPGSVRVGAEMPGLEFPLLEYHDLDNRIRARYRPHYRNIDRSAFDAWLIERAAAAGAEVGCGMRAAELDWRDDGVYVRFSADWLRAQWVIDATGAAALTRRRLQGPAVSRLHALQGAAVIDPPVEAMWAIYQTAYTPFFSWVIPKGEGVHLLGTALTRAGLRQARGRGWDLLRPLLEYLARRGCRVQLLDERPRGAQLTCPAGGAELWHGRGPLLAIGEAAGLVSPFSGEGISYALQSAEAAAFAVIGGMGAQALPELLSRPLRRLSGAMLRARVAAWPWLRPWALWLLPLHTREPLEYLRWDTGLRAV